MDSRQTVTQSTLLSLRRAYALANREAAALIRAHSRSPLALLDLQGEIERGADKANEIVLRAQCE
jgi:hypothetical protein